MACSLKKEKLKYIHFGAILGEQRIHKHGTAWNKEVVKNETVQSKLTRSTPSWNVTNCHIGFDDPVRWLRTRFTGYLF